MLTSRDYSLDDLKKLVIETSQISDPNHSYMFWGHIWVKEGHKNLNDRELIHKGIHMVQEDEVNFITMLLFLIMSMIYGLSAYVFILGILWIAAFWFTSLFYILEVFSVMVLGCKKNPLETEALMHQGDREYLKKRKPFAWIKYMVLYFFKDPDRNDSENITK